MKIKRTNKFLSDYLTDKLIPNKCNKLVFKYSRLFCDVEKFKMTHRPYDEKYNYGLTKMDEDAIKKAKQKTCIIKQYNSTIRKYRTVEKRR